MHLLIISVLLGSLSGLSASASWTQQSFPNPVYEPVSCGRSLQSWICDPDHVLSVKSKDIIEGVLKLIATGDEPYKKTPCGTAGSVGFQVAVAIMRSFETPYGADKEMIAERFAKGLHDSWGVGHEQCNNGVLLLLSLEDRQIYISTGRGAVSSLSNDAIAKIMSSVKPILRGGRYEEAVERAVVDIGLALANKLPDSDSEGSGYFGTFMSIGMVTAFVSFIVWAIRNGWKEQSRYNDCKTKLEKLKRDQARLQAGGTFNPTSCPICLEDFDPPAGSGTPASEPVNGEDDPSSPLLGLQARVRNLNVDSNAAGSSSESMPEPASSSAGPKVPRKPLVLPCKHTFCEACISSWVNQKKLSCPVCRKPIDEAPDDNSAPRPPRPPCNADQDTSQAGMDPLSGAYQQPYAGYRDQRYRNRGYMHQDLLRDELLFRLLMMRRRYPRYIDERMVRTWNDDIVAGREVSPTALREFQMRDPAVRAELANSGARGAHSNFGGGSSRGGGGRGSSW